jgi:uncharacterized protein with HEPN domain
MPPSLADRVRHILEAINDIEAALVGIGSDQLAANRMLRAGIERKLEVISEASRHIPEEVKASEPDIPWQSSETGYAMRIMMWTSTLYGKSCAMISGR